MDVNDNKFIKMYNELKSNFEDFSLYVNNTVNDIKTDINDVNNKKNDKLLIYNYELHPSGAVNPPVKNNKFYMISIEFSFNQSNGIMYYDSAIISNTVGRKKLFCIFEKGLIDDATYKYEVAVNHGENAFSLTFVTYRLNEDTGV
jgi:hypothetical protein